MIEEPMVKAIIVLDSDGNRISSKYFEKTEFPTKQEQSALEKKIFSKTKNMSARIDADILIMDSVVSVFRQAADATFFVVGSSEENELVLASVLDCFYGAVNSLLRGQTDRMTLVDNLELLLLAIDEIVDGGIILELESQAVVNRVLMKGADSEVPAAELTISQAIATAKQQWARSFFSGRQ